MQIAKYKPYGIEIAFNMLNKAMKNKETKYLVYYDPDIDGLLAGYLGEKLLNKFGRKTEYYINPNRQHGFVMTDEELEKYKDYFILAVDFSITEEELKKIVSKGINIISIDHHEIETDFIDIEIDGYRGVILNNQYSFEPDEHRYLSGAGMVYYFMDYIYKQVGLEKVEDEYAVLVGITLLSDVRAIENQNAKQFLEETYNNDSQLVKDLIEITMGEYLSSEAERRYGGFGRITKLYRNYIDFTFSPKFNALFRLNLGEDAIELIKGNPKIRRKYTEDFLIDKIKQKQNEIRDNIIECLEQDEYSNLDVRKLSNKFERLEEENSQDYNITNFIGLACSNIKGNNKTTLVYREDTEDGYVERGSVRGLYDEVDYLTIFQECGFNAAGHKVAFGVIRTDVRNIDWKLLNEKIRIAEEIARDNKKTNKKILNIENLATFLVGENKKIPIYNSYVRSQFRVYLKYNGTNYTRKEIGKLVEYKIDGIKVKSFDKEQTLENSLILAVIDKGGLIDYTLRRMEYE